MVNSGRLEFIGLRAVLADVGKYLQEAKRIEQADSRIAAANTNVALVSQRNANKINTLTKQLADSRDKQRIAAQAHSKALIKADEDRLAAAVAADRVRKVQSLATGGFKTVGGQPIEDVAKAASLVSNEARIKSEKSFAEAKKLSDVTIKATARSIALDTSLKNANTVATLTNADAERRLTQATASKKITPPILGRLKSTAPVAAGIAAVGAGLFTAASINEAAKYQDSLTKIDNLTNLTTKETQELGKAILEMTKTIPVSADELGAGAYEALSRSQESVEETTKFVEQAAKAAVGGFADLKEIIITVTGIVNAYGATNISTTQALDILFATVKVGGGEFNDYAQNIGRVAQISRGLGVTFDQVGAAIAVLTNVGIPANQATTALLGILNQIADPSKEAEKALLTAGTSIQELRASIRDKGLLPALQDMLKLFGNNVEVIGTLFPEVRGFSGALALLAQDSDKFNAAQKDIANSGGIVNKAFDNTKNNFNATAKILKGTLTRAMIEFGTAALPIVTTGMKLLNDLLPLIGTGFKGLGESIKLVATNAITAVNFMIKAVVAAIENIRPLVNALADVGNKVGGVIGLPKIPELPKVGDSTIGSLLGVEDLNKALKDVDDASSGTAINLGKLKPEFNDVALNAKKLAEEALKKLSEEFKSSSEAAGQVASLTAEMNLFGQVSRELAASISPAGTSLQDLAKIAGNIQGVDAVAASLERSQNKMFNFTAALSTVAQVFVQVQSGARGAASALNQLVTAFAKASLEASKAAASAVFANPTREVADLSLRQAQNNLSTLPQRRANAAADEAAERSNDAAGRAIDAQLDALNKQIEAARKSDSAANSAAKKAASDREKAAKKAARDAENAAQDAAKAIVDQMRISNILAQQAYERFNDRLERLIDSNKEAQSALQETFKASNEDLQKQINAAVGQGDTAGALELIDQQKAASAAYKDQSKVLKDANTQLEKQQKAATLEERERSRQAELAMAYAQAQSRQTSSIEENTEVTEEETGAKIDSTVALEAQKEKLEAQKEALDRNKESVGSANEALDKQSQAIQDQLDLYAAETAVMQALVTASDQTLLSQQEQVIAARFFAGQIFETSSEIRRRATSIFDLIPGAEEANEAFALFKETMRIQTNAAFRDNLIAQGVDPTVLRMQILNAALDEAAAKVKGSGTTAEEIAAKQAELIALQAAAVTGAEQILADAANQVSGAALSSVTGFDAAAQGGYRAAGGLQRVEGAASRVPTVFDNAGRKVAEFARGLDTTSKGLAGWVARIIANRVPDAKNNAEGGIYSRPTNINVGETFQKELVLPLERPQRARELLAQIPPGLAASLRTPGGGQNIFAPNINVTGETLDSMEATAMQAVRVAFREARSTSMRSGGRIGQGLSSTS